MKKGMRPGGRALRRKGMAKEQYEQFFERETGQLVRKRVSRRFPVWGIVLISLLLFLTGVYFYGVYFHSTHFAANTRLNGHEIGWKTVEEADALLTPEKDDYGIRLLTKTGEFEIRCGEGGISRTYSATLKSLLEKQNPFLWPVESLRDERYRVDYVTECDKTALIEYLDALPFMDNSKMLKSQDAYVTMEGGVVTVVPEKTGTEVNKYLVYDTVQKAAENGQESCDLIYTNDCYVHANITKDSPSIAEIEKNAEEYLKLEVCYTFGDYTYKLSKEDLNSFAWIAEDGTVRLSESNIRRFPEKLAERFDSYGKDRTFVTHDGRTIIVEGGYYGWIIDQEAEAEEFYDLMRKKESFTKAPVCTQEGYSYGDFNDIGDSYVEVDLAQQHVYMVVDKEIVYDTDCVTGRPSMITPEGTYPITYCKKDAVLRGPGYATPVAYWMPFNGGIGLHDATWRHGVFGGDIWTYDGSHGCVNLPLEAAAVIYEYVEKGFPVVCYWDE